MKLTFSATNPCHMWDMAKALHGLGALERFHSGYPACKLRGLPPDLPLKTHSLRTLITYGLLRLPPRLRPANKWLFPWQDHWFDRQVARSLQAPAVIHAMPGQCLETFRAAKKRGAVTVMNHATGPVSHLIDAVASEYERAGIDPAGFSHYDQRYLEREAEERAVADYHCCASRVVASQLEQEGIKAETIQIVPYAADPDLFYPPKSSKARSGRLIFAGQVGLRKGFRFLLEALEMLAAKDLPTDLSLEVFGPLTEETRGDREAYRGSIPVRYHGPVAQKRLAEQFRTARALILPSLEEGFGLVVPQALACGCPCLVSSAVGAADLITPGLNGSIFTAGSAEDLARALTRIPGPVSAADFQPVWSWTDAARRLLELSAHLRPYPPKIGG